MARQKYVPKSYWTDEVLRASATPYSRRMDFKLKNNRAYNKAIKRGKEFMDSICSHMDPPLTAAYGDEELANAAKLHKTRRDFEKYNTNEYHAAHKRGKEFLDMVCSHIIPVLHHTYTDDELREIALLYGRMVDFKNKNSGAYSAAYDRGLGFLKNICSHMKRGISEPERALLGAIQEYFSDAKKFRATKLKISGKEYIKTLEVDILVKELGKAIEYDGGWHHSFEGLKRGHPTWPVSDIAQYHEIKDSAFLALGIEILHIKQSEWKLNKEDCIQKCLNFLGVSKT